MSFIIQPASSGNSTQLIAKGSLATGDTVVVNTDGTVSVVQNPIATGVVFSTGSLNGTSSAYDPVNNRVVVVYDDGGAGYAVVGTIASGVISFGTPVSFTASANQPSIAYDANAQKVVIAYTAALNVGEAIVGTVSGTSISFGTAVQFNIATVTSPAIVYDANAQKVVISYADSTTGKSIVGTVSGTSISFGTAVTFYAGALGSNQRVESTYDVNAQKVLVCYNQNSVAGYAIVGTVSGTSISFGTAVQFSTGNVLAFNVAYDNNAQKSLIVFVDSGVSSYGVARVATISGTAVSYGTAVVFNSANTFFNDYASLAYNSTLNNLFIPFRQSSALFYYITGTISGTSVSFNSKTLLSTQNLDNSSVAYDSIAQRMVVSVRNGSVTNDGYSYVINPAVDALTANNFIGFSQSNYTTGQTATINIIGGIQTGLSGLTPGSGYYVQTNNTLSTAAGSPSVYAGVALSSTSILVKG